MVLYSYKPSYIWNDEDVFGYLLQINHEKCRSVLHVEFSNEDVQLSEEDDKTDVYVGLSDGDATDIEAGDEDGTENDATDYEGTGGVLTFHEDIEMHDGVYQPRDDGMNLVSLHLLLEHLSLQFLVQHLCLLQLEPRFHVLVLHQPFPRHLSELLFPFSLPQNYLC
ncbi:hypothetical protein Bca4012_087851 [Brassica carinata]